MTKGLQKLIDIIKGNKKEELSLTGLTLDPFLGEEARERVRKGEKERKRYEKKHGEEWFEYYNRDKGRIVDYDTDMKTINIAIVRKSDLMLCGTPESVIRKREKWRMRLKELFGPDCDYYKFFSDESLNPKEALICDALKTGKWKELPDELQTEYHKRVSDNDEK